MADHVDIGRRIGLQDIGHIIEDGEEVRLDIGLAGGKGHIARHHQIEVLALAAHGHARPAQAFAHLALLTVHVIADARAREGADTGADQRIAAVITARQRAKGRARKRAANGPGAGAVLGDIAVLVGGGVCGGHGQCHAGNEKRTVDHGC